MLREIDCYIMIILRKIHTKYLGVKGKGVFNNHKWFMEY